MSVSGGSATEATISGLMPSTTYSIQVAAETSAGTGPYSDLQALTAGIVLLSEVKVSIMSPNVQWKLQW